jgi:RNA polymerase sigma-70 factor (ECF subfamily)
MRLKAEIKEEFSRLIQKNQLILHKICRVYEDNPVNRKDLFQEMCLQLWRSYPQFSHRSAFSTWLYRVALNTAISMLRKNSRSIETLPLQDFDLVDGADPVEREQTQRLYSAISKLNAVEKALILLWLEDKSYEEISEVLGISKSNVSVKLVRIRKKLIKLIDQIE